MKEKELSDSDVDDSINPSHQSGINLNKESYSEENPTVKNSDKNVTIEEMPVAEQNSENESRDDILVEEISSLKKSSKGTFDNINSIFNIEELTSDDEVYFFQCPENYLKQDLCNETLDFSKFKPSVTLNGEVYTLELLNSEKEFITLAVPGKASCGLLVTLPLKGHIIIQKDVDMVPSDSKDKNASDGHKIVFPNDLKVRHPLLGVEWESYIESANEAIGKNNFTKSPKKNTKKKKNFESSGNENKRINIENSPSEIVVPSKKKKKQ